MNKRVYISCYILALFLVFLYFGSSYQTQSFRSRSFKTNLYVEIDKTPVEVHTEEEFCECGKPITDFTGTMVTATSQYQQGPLNAGLRFYSTTSFLWDPSTINTNDWGDHTNNQFELAIEKAVEFAQQDPYYARYKPGSPPFTEYYPAEIVRAGLGLLGALFGPALAARFVGYMKLRSERSTAEYRIKHQLCVHCLYPTSGLNSEICPECGQHHGTVYSSPA